MQASTGLRTQFQETAFILSPRDHLSPTLLTTGYRFRGFHAPSPAYFPYFDALQNSKYYTCYYSFVVKDAIQEEPKGRQRMGVEGQDRVCTATMSGIP